MRVAMMLVMHVNVEMLDRRVRVPMPVRFAEEAPDADGHQCSGEAETEGDRLREHANGRDRTDERRGREVRARA